jgi:hypothetical protein
MKNLIIVCEEKLRSYGDFLSQLISLEDDENENIVGIKDGSVKAQVWTESHYEDNSTAIASEQYILFIGNSKLLKEKRSHMFPHFSQFGMNFGWLGKQGYLYVEKGLSLDEYQDFVSFAQGNNQDIKLLVEKKEKQTTKDV